MTATQYLLAYLDANWQTDITGRIQPVPKPSIEREHENTKRMLGTTDLLEVGGTDTDYAAGGFYYSEEDADSSVVIELRTKNRRDDDTGDRIDGYERLWGVRDENNDEERWGGLVGECRRLLLEIRRGSKEWDIVTAPEAVDTSDNVGQGNFRADIRVELTSIANPIDTST
ncbi:hypothetical protein Hbl1158_10155 [Halobaculum sp. CBA1158]|uniref:hypothetical protein n=1 Tax=Halobaculum sp. CBA1158 TaxID=2904243 RepID=UPI001F21011E|nr:hypothetical protein [Halobaculum sp. CBA1158]UIO98896.1 hypothetical protein Hbl1158_10155 [Halobaculum sp. CBA1158]